LRSVVAVAMRCMTTRGSDRFVPAGQDWHDLAVSAQLHVHRFGPPGPARLLAVHGLTGHGRRWEHLAATHLPELTVLAPDLIGHGRSPWAAPWTIDANAAALAALLRDNAAPEPVVVVSHSFGGAIALRLAATHPELVSSLVLLDPAVGLDGAWMAEIADAMYASPDYSDAAEARDEKAYGSWADVDASRLEVEVAEHLIDLPNGRVGWRVSIPAMMAYWSELAREIVVPPAAIPVTLARATGTSPPYVDAALVEALGRRPDFRLVDLDCDHMVEQARPVETAQLIRDRLDR
jgi:lipase